MKRQAAEVWPAPTLGQLMLSSSFGICSSLIKRVPSPLPLPCTPRHTSLRFEACPTRCSPALGEQLPGPASESWTPHHSAESTLPPRAARRTRAREPPHCRAGPRGTMMPRQTLHGREGDGCQCKPRPRPDATAEVARQKQEQAAKSTAGGIPPCMLRAACCRPSLSSCAPPTWT